MKKVLLLLFVLLSLVLNGQNAKLDVSNTKPITIMQDGIGTLYSEYEVSTVYSDDKIAVKYLTPKTEKLLEKISKKSETTTNQLWGILVKQQKVWSWCYLLGIIICLISWINFYKLFNKANTELDGDGSWKVQNTLSVTSLFVISCILSFFSASHLIPMMTGFLNPEFGALQTIAEIAKSLK